MRLPKYIVSCVTGLLVAQPVCAEQLFDVSLKLGAYGGILTRPKSADELEDPRLRFGGIVASGGIHRGFSEDVTLIAQASLVVDVTSNQLVRQGVDLGVAYHLLGGAKAIHESNPLGELTWKNPYDVSLVLLGGTHRYTVSNPDDTSENITGSSFDMQLGLEGRRDFSLQSIGCGVYSSIHSVPTGVERVSVQGAEFSLFWRLLI